jgi:hypothetical protein
MRYESLPPEKELGLEQQPCLISVAWLEATRQRLSLQEIPLSVTNNEILNRNRAWN